jgi:hypothetical protein
MKHPYAMCVVMLCPGDSLLKMDAQGLFAKREFLPLVRCFKRARMERGKLSQFARAQHADALQVRALQKNLLAHRKEAT